MGPKGAKLARPDGGWPVLRAASGLGAQVTEGGRSALAQWLDLLAGWNARVDLTAARSSDELVDLMVADALVLAARVPRDARVVDVGTGAGAPGLALALLRPDLDVTLVEPLAKRAAFLRTVLGTLDLARVRLDARKGEVVAGAHAQGWDVALARATLAPAAWLDLAADLVPGGGSAWVFLAKEPTPVDARFALAEEVAYAWPLTGPARRLARYVREAGSGGARPGG